MRSFPGWRSRAWPALCGLALQTTFALLTSLASEASHATPVHLEISVDQPLLMKGTVSGSLSELDWGDGIVGGYANYLLGSNFYWRDFAVTLGPQGSNWTVWATLERSDTLTGVVFETITGTQYVLVVKGHHNVAPHSPETAPALDLKTWKSGLSLQAGHFYDSGDDRLVHSFPHPGNPQHADVLTLAVLDLGPNLDGYLSGDGQLSASFMFTHPGPVPEPATLALGLAGLAVCAHRLKRQASREA